MSLFNPSDLVFVFCGALQCSLLRLGFFSYVRVCGALAHAGNVTHFLRTHLSM